MTNDELLEKLKKLGLEQGVWKKSEDREVRIEYDAQKEILRKIRILIEAEAKKNKQLVERLHIAKNKMKFGGGS